MTFTCQNGSVACLTFMTFYLPKWQCFAQLVFATLTRQNGSVVNFMSIFLQIGQEIDQTTAAAGSLVFTLFYLQDP